MKNHNLNKKNGSQHRTKLIALFRLTYESPFGLSLLVFYLVTLLLNIATNLVQTR